MATEEIAISLQNISKRFRRRESSTDLVVLDDFSLDIPAGKTVAFFGPNGCGKTTILNIMAGTDIADDGSVSLKSNSDGRPALAYLFQNFRDTLLPWQTAQDNVAFGLRARNVPWSKARERTEIFLNENRFPIPRRNYPYQLSVGQQQMVAIARGLIQDSLCLLLDEPFSALDHKSRFSMHNLLESIAAEKNTAIVLVSHDVDEALYLSDEVILLSKTPATIVQHFAVPFARPRKHDLLASSEFAGLRQKLMAAFLQEVEK